MESIRRAARSIHVWGAVVVTLLVLIVHFVYFLSNPHYYFFPDTYHYLNRAQEIARGEPLISPFRLPLYPLILKETLGLQGTFRFDSGTVNLIAFQPVILFHFLFELIGVFCFVIVAHQLFGLSWKWYVATLLFGLNIRIFGWEKTVLTESVTITLMILFLTAIVLFITSRRVFFLLGTVFFAGLLFLIRPVYVLLCPLLVPIIVYHFIQKKQRRLAITSGLLLTLTILLPIGYAYGNYRLFHYANISTVSDADLFGKVIQYHLPSDGISVDSPYWPVVQTCLLAHNGVDAIHIEDCITPMNIQDDVNRTKTVTVLGSFARMVIFHHPFSYIGQSIALLPLATVGTDPDPYAWISAESTSPFLISAFEWQLFLFNQIQKIFIIFFLFLCIQPVLFWKNPSPKNTSLMILGCTALYVLTINVFFVQSEYSRLRAPIDPVLILCCVSCAGYVGSWIARLYKHY